MRSTMTDKKKSKKKKDTIAEALDIIAPVEPEPVEEIEVPMEDSIVPLNKEESRELVKEEISKHTDQDYNYVRKNLKEIVNKGLGAIDGILQIASETESPRAYEVAAQLIKSISETNKDIIDLHKNMKDISKEHNTTNNTTNNAIYVGSTKDLQELINTSRSTFRKKPTDEILEAEVIDAEDSDGDQD